MTVSTVIPTYNRRTHLFRAIDSVLAQTFPVDEIVVVDDGSTDGTAEAIGKCYGPRVRVFVQANAGVSAARNRGIREARSEWVAFLDSDDVWHPTKTERQVEVITTLGDKFGLCFTDNLFAGNPDMKRSVFQEVSFEVTGGFGPMSEPTARLIGGREPFFTSSLLVRRSLLEDLEGFDETLIVGEDADLVFRLSFRTNFCFVAAALAVVDRTPSRTGLCDLYTKRDDRKYESFERRYNKWLAMPEVSGSQYERPIREILREFRYDSAEAKLHEFRIMPALGEIGRLRAMEASYAAIFGNLLRRKLAKIRRNRGILEKRTSVQLSGREEKAF